MQRNTQPTGNMNIFHDIGHHVLHTRGSGFTTILALRLIASAMANPGTVYSIEDHFKGDAKPGDNPWNLPPQNTRASQELARTIQRICLQAGFGSVTVNVRQLTVTAARMGATETVPVYVHRNGEVSRA